MDIVTDWVRGETISHGSFAKVDLAIIKSCVGIPPLMAVKSAPVYKSQTLKNEKEILEMFSDSENVISCFGESVSFENGEKLYNVFLEYAGGGSLFDRVRRSGDGLSENEVRSYTRSMLRGLNEIHAKGVVHCDVKLQNILLCSESSDVENGVVAKIADFGLAKRRKRNRVVESRHELRGTPLYMSPEMVVNGEIDTPGDVWAVGCAVVEMFTGAPAWKNESNMASLLLKISRHSPEIPRELSEEARDFVEKCFIRDCAQRWTAEMLLDHRFIAAGGVSYKLSESEKVTTISPRCPFEFPESISPSPILQSGVCLWTEKGEDWASVEWSVWPGNSPAARIRQLAADSVTRWELSDSWLIVR